MRVVGKIAGFVVFTILVPVFIVGILGIVFSPLQMAARASTSCVALEASDIMWDGECDYFEEDGQMEHV